MWNLQDKRPIIKIKFQKKKAKSFYVALNVRTGKNVRTVKEEVKEYDWQNQENTIDFLKHLRKAYPIKKIIFF